MRCEINIESQEDKNTVEWLKKAYPHFSDLGIRDTIHSLVNKLERYPDSYEEAVDNTYLLKELTDPDTIITKSKVNSQIMRAQESIKMLNEVIKKGGSKSQRETIYKILEMTHEYLKYLEDLQKKELRGESISKVRARSVSQTKGTSEFGNAEEYVQFKKFGEFIHFYVEAAINRSIGYKDKDKTNTLRTVDLILEDKDFFKVKLEEWNKADPKNQFLTDIKDLTSDKLFEMMKQMASLEITKRLNNNATVKSITLPEITLFAYDYNGRPIVGRADALVINVEGEVEVIDYKTKKIKYVREMSADEAYDEAIKQLNNLNYTVNAPGADPLFRNDTRSLFNEWAVQIRIYENMLLQNSIPTNGGRVVSLVYSTADKKEDSAFKNFVVIEGLPKHFALQANSPAPGKKQSSFQVKRYQEVNDALKKQKDKADKLIPLDPQQEAVREEIDTPNVFPFDLTEAQWKKLKTNIEQLIEKDRADILRKRSDANVKKQQALIDLYNIMFNGLNSFAEAVKNNDPSVAMSLKFENVLNYLEQTIYSALKDSESIKEVFDSIDSFIKPDGEITPEYNKVLNDILNINNAIQSTIPIYTMMSEVVSEAMRAKDSKVTEDTPVVRRLRELENSYKMVEANYIKLNYYSVAATISKLNLTNSEFKDGREVNSLEQLESQYKDYYAPRVAAMKKELELLESNAPVPLIKGTLAKYTTWLSKSYKEKKLAELPTSEKAKAARIDSLKKSIEHAEMMQRLPKNMQSMEGIKELLENITDPSTMFFMGTQMDINMNFFSKLSFVDDLIAPITNSNPLIVAHTRMLKMAEISSRYDVENSKETAHLDKVLEKAKKSGRSVEDLNKGITEQRVMFIQNEDGTIDTESTKLSLIQPVNKKRDEFLKMKSVAKKKYVAETKELKSQLSQEYRKPEAERNDAEIKRIKDELRNKRNKESQRQKEVLQIERKHFHKKYKDIYYEYMINISGELSEELRDKFEELRTITEKLGLFADEERYKEYRKKHQVLDVNITDPGETQEDIDTDLLTDYERINHIMIEINRLKNDNNDEASAKAIDMFNQIFETKINTNLFKRAKAQIDVKYSDRDTNPASRQAHEDWMRENVITSPTDKWYEDLGEIYDQMAAYSTDDPELTDLIEKRKRIYRIYKLKHRIIDPRFISSADFTELNNIEIALKELRESRSKERSSNPNLDALYVKLNKIKSEVNNPIYEQEFKLRTEELRKAYDVLLTAELEFSSALESEKESRRAKYIFAKEQFNIKEKNYISWFEENHNTKYKSIKDYNPEDYASPSKVNKISFPASEVQDRYTQELPSKKYSYRVLKEEIKNENYQESFDGTPLPIALKVEGNKIVLNQEYLDDPRIPDSEKAESMTYVNDNYINLVNRPQDFELYTALTDAYFTLQKRMNGKVLGYLIPGMNKTTVEIYKNNSIAKAIQMQAREFYDNNLRISSQDDYMRNTYNDDDKRQVRSRFSAQYDESLQSIDGISSIRAWLAEGHYNIAMSNIQPVSKSYIAGLRKMADSLVLAIDKAANKEERDILTTRLNSLESAISQAESEHEKFVRGYTDDEAARSFKKVTTTLMKMFSLARIGFDIANQTKNFISGNVQMYINSVSSDHWTGDDLRWAKGEMYGNFFKKYMESWGKIDDVDPAVQLYRTAQPSQGDIRKYALDAVSSKSRRFMNKVLSFQELAYMLQDKGDKEIAMTLWLAIMHNKKFRMLDKDGKHIQNPDGSFKTISLYHAIEVSKEGFITIREDVDATIEHVKHFTMVAQTEIIKTQGNYAASDKTRAERFVPGMMVMFYRKYLIPMFLNRVGYARPNWVTAEVQYGYYRAFVAMIRDYGPKETFKNLLLAGVSPKKFRAQNSLNNAFYTKKMMHLSRDMVFSLVLMLLVLSTQAYLNGLDDDEEPDMILGNIIRITWGVDREVRSMNPVPIIGGTDEYIRNFTTLTTLTREFTMLTKTISHAAALLFVKMVKNGDLPEEDPDNILEDLYDLAYRSAYYSRKSGVYEEGDPKLLKDFHDLSGYKNINALINPAEKLETMSKTYY